MIDGKCTVSYCDATVGDYDLIVNGLHCPCMKCFGTKGDICDILKRSVKSQIDFRKKMCSKCKFYNGR